MTVMNFDLEDGLPKVSFTLKPDDAERFAAFLAECEQAKADAHRLRAQLQTLGLWIAEVLPTLDTVEPECSTEAELLTALIRRGEMLVLASLARTRGTCPSGKCQDPATDCFGSGCLGPNVC